MTFLCNFAQVFEITICNYIKYFIYRRFSDAQHGFMPGRLTVANLLSFTQFTASIADGGGQVDAIYTDFEKAFDRLDHQFLLCKLSDVGLSPRVLDFFRSYLCQSVFVGAILPVQWCRPRF